jgi:hypothetical protein
VTTFVAVYRGTSVSDARLLAVSSDPSLVAQFVGELVGEEADTEVQDERAPLRAVPDGDEA